MDFFQLRYFQDVAHEGSFARAARRLHASQPSLSIQIKKLESDFRCRLFQRTAQGAHLTPAGERVLASVERIFGEMTELRHDLGEEDLSPFQLLRIGVQPLLASAFLPSLLGKFLKENRHIQIQIVERANALLPELLLRGEVHLVLMARPEVMPKSVEMQTLFSCRYSVFSKSIAALNKHRRWALARLLQEPLLLYRDPLHIEDRLRAMARRIQSPVNILFSSDHAITALDFCAQGLGLAVLPSLVAPKAKTLGLKGKAIHDENLVYDIVACGKQNALLNEPTKRLMEFLKSQDRPTARIS
jgi:DNA-binding transcriptional LysR family regulator